MVFFLGHGHFVSDAGPLVAGLRPSPFLLGRLPDERRELASSQCLLWDLGIEFFVRCGPVLTETWRARGICRPGRAGSTDNKSVCGRVPPSNGNWGTCARECWSLNISQAWVCPKLLGSGPHWWPRDPQPLESQAGRPASPASSSSSSSWLIGFAPLRSLAWCPLSRGLHPE